MPKLPSPVHDKQLPAFRRRLLAWFDRAKRDLEWRRTRDSYRIWVSEIMLQQTRVAAATPYYRRFLGRFPTMQHLARSRVDAVLHAWAGLGYYSRARNLRLAAKQIVARHGGKFPHELADALALPGVGSYTASAVLSIAYDQPYAVLDGNVARVLARLAAVRGDLRRPQTWRRLEETASHLLSRARPGDWNQAMMELGATVCTPRAPRCPECPVARWCQARARGIADQLPSPRRASRATQLTLAVAVLLDPRGRTLVVREQKRESGAEGAGRDKGSNGGALFSYLWQFPAVTAARGSQTEIARHIADVLGVSKVTLEPMATARHAVTFHDIRLAPFLGRIARLPDVAGARTPKLSELDRLPISNATRKIAAAVLAEL